MTVDARLHGTQSDDDLLGSLGNDLIYGFDPAARTVEGFDGEVVTTGLRASRPVQIVTNSVDNDLVFIPTLIGRVVVVNSVTGAKQDAPLLDITGDYPPLDDVTNLPGRGNDKGLSALVFDPDFAMNGKFYTYGTNYDATFNELFEYTVIPGTLEADMTSRRLIARWEQPSTTNHRVGWIGFGPDGYLYVVRADASNPYDIREVTQDADSTLGKILRIDVMRDDFAADPDRNYGIPVDNPFAAGGGAPEIWGMGVRNPFRNSFDPVTGDFWVADVGQNSWEEVNHLPFGTAPGVNLGWVYWEGLVPTYKNPDPTVTDPYTFPIYTYPHAVPLANYSVSGGFVYRGTSEGMHGDYIFGDFSQGKLYSLHQDAGGAVTATDWTDLIAFGSGALSFPVNFSHDAEGNLLVLNITGDMVRLTPRLSGPEDSDDTIQAGLGDDSVYAGGGADSVTGDEGADMLSGMDGDDTLVGGSEDDSLLGGNGQDDLNGGTGSDTVLGGAGDDSVLGAADGDALDGGAGKDTVAGGAGNDSIDGSLGNDRLFGDEGTDTIEGGASADLLSGGIGDDMLRGNLGNDTLLGEGGADTLVGGKGADRFRFDAETDSTFAEMDEILDFSATAKDRIDLRAMVHGRFTFIGDADFHAAGAAELHIVVVAGGVRVEADADGDGSLDFAVLVKGAAGMTAADFLL